MRLAFTLVSLLLATSATASLHFAPDSLHLRVGATATINVSFASLSSMGIGLRFTSCDPSVAIANGEVVVPTGSHYGTVTTAHFSPSADSWVIAQTAARRCLRVRASVRDAAYR